MSNFVTDLTSLAYPKANLRPVPANADPTRYIAYSDWNALCQAVVDCRGQFLAGTLVGFLEAATAPSIAGATSYIWAKTDGGLFYRRGGNNFPIIGSAQVLFWNTATPAQIATTGLARAVLSTNITAWDIGTGNTGQVLTLVFQQDSTGSRTLAGANATIKLQSALTLSTGANKRDTLVLVYNGLHWIEIARHLND